MRKVKNLPRNKIYTDSDRILAEGILSSKWGIQNSLPSTHLYYNSSPNTTFV
jgi:hypothetical protein